MQELGLVDYAEGPRSLLIGFADVIRISHGWFLVYGEARLMSRDGCGRCLQAINHAMMQVALRRQRWMARDVCSHVILLRARLVGLPPRLSDQLSLSISGNELGRLSSRHKCHRKVSLGVPLSLPFLPCLSCLSRCTLALPVSSLTTSLSPPRPLK